MMSSSLLTLFCALLARCSAINWLDSSFSMNVSSLNIEEIENATYIPWVIEVGVSSNREIYRDDGGHFRFSITGSDKNIGDFSATTSCVEVGTAASDVVNMMKSTEYSGPDNTTVAMPLSNIMDITIKRYGDGKIASNFSTVYKIYFRSTSVFTIEVDILQTGCVPLQTFGYWNDGRNWEGGVVPSSSDDVFFPAKSGMVEVSSNVTVLSLNMLGGTLILQKTGCNDGWSLGPATGSLE
jgi:hypothetical protein